MSTMDKNRNTSVAFRICGILVFSCFILLGGCGGSQGGGEGAGSGSGGNFGSGGGTISGESSGKINLAWNSNTEPNIAGYKVYSRKDSETYHSGVDVGLGSQQPNNSVGYTLSGLVKGQRYCISVTAYNKSNRESLFSSEACGIPN